MAVGARRFLRQHFPFPIMLARWAIPHGVLYPPSRRRSVQRIQPALLVAIPLHRRHRHTIPFYNNTSHLTFRYLGSARCRHRLVPFRRWINLLHSGTLLHGPFEFASVNGRKTRDRHSPADWDALAKFSLLYQNPLPRFDLPSYSIHVDRGIHSTFCDQANADALCAAANCSDDRLYP